MRKITKMSPKIVVGLLVALVLIGSGKVVGQTATAIWSFNADATATTTTGNIITATSTNVGFKANPTYSTYGSFRDATAWWTSEDQTGHYIQYTVQPTSGNTLNVTSISVGLSASSSSINIFVAYSTDGTTWTHINTSVIALTSSTSQTTYTSGTAPLDAVNVSLSSGTFYVRLFPYGASAVASKYLYVKNMTISGTTSPSGGSAPTISFSSVPTSIGTTTATGAGGTISNIGSGVNTSGVCYNTLAAPTIANSFTTDGPTIATSYTNSNLSSLTPNTQYYLRAYATNSTYGTGYGPSDVTFTTLPNAPTIAAPGIPSSSSIVGNWTAPSPLGTATYAYVFEYGTDSGFGAGTFTDLSVAAGTLTKTINSGLTANTTYYYRVKATNLSGAQSSAWSAYQTTATTNTTKLTTPVLTLGPIAATNQGFTAQWAAVNNASSYSVNIYQGSTLITGLTGLTGITGTTVGVTGLVSNTTYSYTVTAIGDGISYANSDESSKSSTIRTKSTLKAITAFTISGVVATITESTHSITASVLYGTDVTNLTPSTITISANATYITSGARNFTSPVTYTVTAEDGSTQDYVVTISVLPASSIKAITAFTITGQGSSVITESTHTIDVLMPSGTDRLTLAPNTISVSDAYATVSPAAGVMQDFRTAKTYTVTAQDGTIQAYTVNVRNQTSVGTSCGFIGYDYTVPGVTLAWAQTGFPATPYTFNIGTSQEYNLTGDAASNIKSATVCNTNSITHYELGASTAYLEIQLTTGNSSASTISSVELTGSGNSTSGPYTAGIIFSGSTMFDMNNVLGAYQTAAFPLSSGTWAKIDIASADIPSGTKSIRIYRRIYYNSSTHTASTSSGGGTQYGDGNTIRVASLNVCVAGSGVMATQLTAPSVAPASSISSTGFTANWSNVSNEIGYTVNVYKTLDNSLVKSVSAAANATSASISGLNAATSYYFKVIALGDGDTYTNSTESSASSVSTLAAYSISAASNDINKGAVSSVGGMYDAGASVSFTATPASGSYRFVNWTEGGNFVSVANPYTFSASVGRLLVANFADFTSTVSTPINATTIAPCPSCDVIVVGGGLLTVDAPKTFNSVTIAPGGKLTLTDGNALTAAVTLQSSASGTATILTPANQSVSATVQQYQPQGRNWYIGSPVISGNSSSLVAAGTGSSVSYYDEPSSVWVNNYSGALTQGKGYVAVSNSGSSTNNVVFSGTLNNGTVNVDLTRQGSTKAGFNLIANPYPSYLNVLGVLNANINLEKTVWYRTQSAGTTPTYYFETVNTASGIGTNDSGTGTVTGYIPPLQAFWVRTNANTTLTFDNTMRYHAGSVATDAGSVPTTVMKAPSGKNSINSLLRLQVSNGINNDEAVVYFNENAANGFDDYDSPKLSNNNVAIPEIYTLAGTEQLVINGMNSIPLNEEISLGFVPGTATSFSLKATELTNFDADTQIVLKDYATGAIQDLTDGTPYIFYPDNAVPAATRFTLIFKSASVATGIPVSGNANIRISTNANNQMAIQYNGNTKAENSVEVYNAIGQKLASKQLSKSVTILDTSFMPGVYIVVVIVNGKTSTQKVIIN